MLQKISGIIIVFLMILTNTKENDEKFPFNTCIFILRNNRFRTNK